ncbi:MAG: hypothetical protein GXO32_06920 [Crenarchaeota archaeon]|nr:hypothetical protein [Thermoproteota archaeon]
MSVRATYPIGANLKKIAQACSAALEEVPVIFSSEGMIIEGLSPDKAIMLSVFIPATAFEEYNVSEETSVVAPKDEFVKAFKRATKRDRVTFELSPGSREMVIRVTNVRTSVEREYIVSLSEVGYQRIGELDIDLEVNARMPSDELANIVKDVAIVADEATFQFTSETNAIRVQAFGDLGEYRTELKQFKPLTLIESTVSAASSKYSVDHLKILAKVLDLADEVTIAFGPDKPLKAELDIGGGRVVLWIAPRA